MATQETTPTVLKLPEFIKRNRISRSTYFSLPIKPAMIGRGLITLKAEAEWHSAMEEHYKSEAARLEHARRVEQARVAGKKAAKSEMHVSKQKTKKRRA